MSRVKESGALSAENLMHGTLPGGLSYADLSASEPAGPFEAEVLTSSDRFIFPDDDGSALVGFAEHLARTSVGHMLDRATLQEKTIAEKAAVNAIFSLQDKPGKRVLNLREHITGRQGYPHDELIITSLGGSVLAQTDAKNMIGFSGALSDRQLGEVDKVARRIGVEPEITGLQVTRPFTLNMLPGIGKIEGSDDPKVPYFMINLQDIALMNNGQSHRMQNRDLDFTATGIDERDYSVVLPRRYQDNEGVWHNDDHPYSHLAADVEGARHVFGYPVISESERHKYASRDPEHFREVVSSWITETEADINAEFITDSPDLRERIANMRRVVKLTGDSLAREIEIAFSDPNQIDAGRLESLLNPNGLGHFDARRNDVGKEEQLIYLADTGGFSVVRFLFETAGHALVSSTAAFATEQVTARATVMGRFNSAGFNRYTNYVDAVHQRQMEINGSA